jgi:hypothetical protein
MLSSMSAIERPSNGSGKQEKRRGSAALSEGQRRIRRSRHAARQRTSIPAATSRGTPQPDTGHPGARARSSTTAIDDHRGPLAKLSWSDRRFTSAAGVSRDFGRFFGDASPGPSGSEEEVAVWPWFVPSRASRRSTADRLRPLRDPELRRRALILLAGMVAGLLSPFAISRALRAAGLEVALWQACLRSSPCSRSDCCRDVAERPPPPHPR